VSDMTTAPSGSVTPRHHRAFPAYPSGKKRRRCLSEPKCTTRDKTDAYTGENSPNGSNARTTVCLFLKLRQNEDTA
jgi:hypothetical protein